MTIAGSILYGLANLLHPRMLWLMVWPMLVSLGLWGLVALFVWVRTAVRLADFIKAVVPFELGDAALIAAHVVLFLLFVPAVYLTALFILGVFGMQKMVDHVAAQSFPHLERRRGGSTANSVWNGVVALCGMALIFLVTAPLWVLPPLWPLIPLAALTWGNQKLLRYDALAEHADATERERIFRERRGGMYVMGLLLALAAYVPIIGFVAPVVFGLAFIRYLLGALDAARKGGLHETARVPSVAGPDAPRGPTGAV